MNQRPRDIFGKGEKLEKERKYFLGKTGEYGTMSKLARHGIDAFLTNGNRKSFDIVATGSGKSVTIQVKTSREKSFPTRFFQTYYDAILPSPDYWVFVHTFAESNERYRERFFVLSHDELKQIQGKIVLPYFRKLGAKTVEDIMKIEKDKIENKEKVGVDNVTLEHIKVHEDRFDKIYQALNQKT